MALPIQDFLGIVNRGWMVVIKTAGPQDAQTGDVQVESATVVDLLHPDRSFTVAPVDGQVDAEQVFKALVFLNGAAPMGERGDAQHRLVLSALASDPDKLPPLPEGLSYQKAAEGGVTIVDPNGDEFSSIARGASIAEAGDAAVGAMATRAAAGLMSSPAAVLPAAGAEMRVTADVADEEIDALVAGLGAMSADRRPMRADPSAADIRRMKTDRAAARQRGLQSAVEDARATKGLFSKGTLESSTLSDLCRARGFRFQYTWAGKEAGYQITDADGALVAMGPLKSKFNDERYLSREEAGNLVTTLGDGKRQALVDVMPPETLRELAESDRAVSEYAADTRARTPDDPKDPRNPDDPDGRKRGDVHP
jgi:hypothetical protein